MTKIIIATTNKGKFNEIMEMLSPASNVQFEPLPSGIEAPVESGSSYHDNALIKAKHYHLQTGLPVIAEDSGIEVEALKNQLGVQTRRFGAGETASDEEWLNHFLDVMKNEKNRSASFICVTCIMVDTENFVFFDGKCDGALTSAPEAPIENGIPLSSCFKPEGSSVVYSKLSKNEKNAVSHRGKAMLQLKNYLLKNF